MTRVAPDRRAWATAARSWGRSSIESWVPLSTSLYILINIPSCERRYSSIAAPWASSPRPDSPCLPVETRMRPIILVGMSVASC